MKNIFVLPSKQTPIKGDLLLRHIWKKHPQYECISWWRYKETITIENVVQYTTLNGSFRDVVSSFEAQNIYITSDELIPIKDGEWYFKKIRGTWNLFNYLPHKTTLENDVHFFSDCRKVILTTDQDLIKDGVQAIDDEFLEWFVKNSSCEFVKVKYITKEYVDEQDAYGYDINYYKPIIPQEPKQETIEEETLSKIKFVLLANNNAQAIRLLEQYGKFQKEKICDSEVLQRIRATLSDAEARRIIRTI